jgi:NADH-quinone oxidoreductase subunit E
MKRVSRDKEQVARKAIDAIIAKYTHKPGELLGLLEEIQERHPFRYLPEETLRYVAEKTGTPLATLYSVVTFYAFFNLSPQGEHSIVICRGTACHTRKSRELLEYLGSSLGFGPDQLKEGEKVFLTTKDGKFTIKTVACFGQCALAPVVEIDGSIHSNMTQPKLKAAIDAVSRRRPRR